MRKMSYQFQTDFYGHSVVPYAPWREDRSWYRSFVVMHPLRGLGCNCPSFYMDMLKRLFGLTALYNLFHNQAEEDAELEEMWRLQREIDVAVRDSRGWQDIDLEYGFHEVGDLPVNDNVRYTISESARIEILKCLSALNRQRWEAEEKAGLHKKGKKG